jgi:hypothetical protein
MIRIYRIKRIALILTKGKDIFNNGSGAESERSVDERH